MKPSSLNPFAIFAAAVTLMAISAPAMAQQTILVINEDQILRESAVGQHIASRLQAISTELDNELRALRTPIDEEAERLNAETAGITQEAMSAAPGLASAYPDCEPAGSGI
jgi:outer membrane protein